MLRIGGDDDGKLYEIVKQRKKFLWASKKLYSLRHLCIVYFLLYGFGLQLWKLLINKQVNKEKISFGRLEVHEIAAFVRNASGHYEAINRNSTNYYLSVESVALFTDHLPSRPKYIVGQIVHIERQAVKQQIAPCGPGLNPATSDHSGTDRLTLNSGSTSANPYGLPIGCEYFVVTVAMLPPDTAIHSPPTPSSSASWSLPFQTDKTKRLDRMKWWKRSPKCT